MFGGVSFPLSCEAYTVSFLQLINYIYIRSSICQQNFSVAMEVGSVLVLVRMFTHSLHYKVNSVNLRQVCATLLRAYHVPECLCGVIVYLGVL